MVTFLFFHLYNLCYWVGAISTYRTEYCSKNRKTSNSTLITREKLFLYICIVYYAFSTIHWNFIFFVSQGIFKNRPFVHRSRRRSCNSAILIRGEEEATWDQQQSVIILSRKECFLRWSGRRWHVPGGEGGNDLFVNWCRSFANVGRVYVRACVCVFLSFDTPRSEQKTKKSSEEVCYLRHRQTRTPTLMRLLGCSCSHLYRKHIRTLAKKTTNILMYTQIALSLAWTHARTGCQSKHKHLHA